MSSLFRAAVFSAVLVYPACSFADHLFVHVPVGRQGTITAPSLAQSELVMRSIPGGADLIPADAYKNGYALGMADMLKTTPGVFAQPRWGEESRLSIRGSGLSRGFHLRGLMILQDGIPFNFADGSSDFQELDPLALRNLEVYRGGQALRFGGTTLGGAVNAVSLTARDLDHDALVRLEGGSFHTMRTHAQAGRVFDRADVFASMTKTLSEGYREHNEQNNARFNGNVGLQFGDGHETRFYVGWNDINQNIPGSLSRAVAESRPESGNVNNIIDQHARDIRSLRVGNRTAFDLGAGQMLEVGWYMNNKDLYHPIFQVVNQQSLDLGAFARLKGSSYTLGINMGRGYNDAKRFVNEGGTPGAMMADAKQLARNMEIYGENRTPLSDGISLILGAQAGWYGRDYTDHRNAANNATKNFSSFNPKIGLLWQPNSQTEIYASLTRASEVPTFSELVQGAIPGFVPVELQKSWTAEIGTRGEAGAWNWDATFYHARIQDEMLQFAVGPSIPASTFNAGETIHQGIELGFGYKLTENLSLQAIYNLNDFRFDGDAQYGDNDLAGAPMHQIKLSLPYTHGAWTIEPSVEYIPQGGWIDYANTERAEVYAVWNVKASLEATDDIEIFLDARNLTDETYTPSYGTVTDARTANTEVYFPGDGRSAFLGMQIKF